jgi:hypothetical protein
MKSGVAHRCFLSFVFQGESSAEGGPTEGPPDRHTPAASGPSSSSSLRSLWSQRLKNLLFIHRQDPVPQETSLRIPSFSHPAFLFPEHSSSWARKRVLVTDPCPRRRVQL